MGKHIILLSLIFVFSLPVAARKPNLKVLTTASKIPAVKLPSLPKLNTNIVLRATRVTPLSGKVLFSQVIPGWKTPFITKFTAEHLRTIEDAFQLTDAHLFTEENGLVVARSADWNYTEQFEQELTCLLQQRGQTLSSSQWKQIFGGSGVKGVTLANHLRLLTLDAWLLTHGGEYPRRQFSVDGNVLKPEDLSPEQKMEQNLANGIKWAVAHPKDLTDPIFLNLKLRYEQGFRKKTPQYWLEELKLWLVSHNGEYPRSSFSNGERLSAEELTPAQKQEAMVANGVNNAIALAKDRSDPVIAELIELKEAGRRTSSPEETLAEVEQWAAQHNGRMPRSSIVKNGRYVSSAELTPEELKEKRLAARARALTQNPALMQNPAVQQLKNLFQNASHRKTSTQVLEELQYWVSTHEGFLPRTSMPKQQIISEELRQEVALGRAVINQLYNAQLHPTPQTEQIRQLWQNGRRQLTRRSPEEWLQAFQMYIKEYKHLPMRGTPEYMGIRNVLYRSAKKPDGSYVNPAVQELYQLNQLARAASRGEKSWKEVISETGEESQLKRFWREATPQDKAALQATAEDMDFMRDDFKDWLTDAVANDWLVLASKTYEALSSVRRGLDEWFDDRAYEAEDILVWLNDTPWGKDEENNIFSRILFVGKNPANPRLKDFREVQEFDGVPIADMPKLPETVASTARLMNENDGRVMELRVLPGATPEDLHLAIKKLLPEDNNFTLRMGLHELGVSITEMAINKHFKKGLLHLHAEMDVPEEPVIVSFTLKIDMRRQTKGKSFPQLKRLYYNWFRPYLSADAANFLR